MVILAASSWMSISVIPKNLLVAQIIWLLGWFLAIFAVLIFSQISDLSYLLLILPIIAATLIGWFQGLLVTGILFLIYHFIPFMGFFPDLPSPLPLVTLVFGAVSVLVSASYYYALQNFFRWAFHYYQSAQSERKNAEDQRVEFHEVQEDLFLANKELKRMTDQLASCKDFIANAPIDLIESLTPPPEGDMTLSECRAVWPEKLFWSNINVACYELPEEDLKAEVLNRVEQGSSDGHLLAFEVSEQYPENWRKSLDTVLDALQETRS